MATFTLFDLSRWRQSDTAIARLAALCWLGLARQAAGLGLLLALLVALTGLLCIHLSAQQGPQSAASTMGGGASAVAGGGAGNGGGF